MEINEMKIRFLSQEEVDSYAEIIDAVFDGILNKKGFVDHRFFGVHIKDPPDKDWLHRHLQIVAGGTPIFRHPLFFNMFIWDTYTPGITQVSVRATCRPYETAPIEEMKNRRGASTNIYRGFLKAEATRDEFTNNVIWKLSYQEASELSTQRSWHYGYLPTRDVLRALGTFQRGRRGSRANSNVATLGRHAPESFHQLLAVKQQMSEAESGIFSL